MVRYRQRLDERETRVARHDIEASDIAYFYLKLLPKWSQLSVCLPGRDRFHKWLWVAYCILIALTRAPRPWRGPTGEWLRVPLGGRSLFYLHDMVCVDGKRLFGQEK